MTDGLWAQCEAETPEREAEVLALERDVRSHGKLHS
jgi:hypothetical protein